MKIIKILLTGFLLSAMITGCKKYDDGPAFSLKTKKARLARTWRIDKYIDNTGGSVQGNAAYTMTFERDGAVTVSNPPFNYTGTWDFTSDKSGIVFSYGAFGYVTSETSTILRLTSKDLWLEDTWGDKTYFVAQ